MNKSFLGFTLVELMISLVILGILAAIAVPSYREYLYSAKLAEGYVGISAINKSQTAFFIEKKHFVPVNTSSVSGAIVTPPARTKAAITLLDSDSYKWNALGSPIAPGTNNYFLYLSDTRHFNNSAQSQLLIYTAPNTYHFQNLPVNDIHQWKIQVPIGESRKNFQAPFTNESLGLLALPNHDWMYTMAAASLKGNNCSFLVQTLIPNGGEIRSSPLITIRE